MHLVDKPTVEEAAEKDAAAFDERGDDVPFCELADKLFEVDVVAVLCEGENLGASGLERSAPGGGGIFCGRDKRKRPVGSLKDARHRRHAAAAVDDDAQRLARGIAAARPGGEQRIVGD